MAQDRGRRSDFGGGYRGDYETDDLRFRRQSGGYGGDYESGRGRQQRAESFSRDWSAGRTRDQESRQQSGDWFPDDYEARGYGQGGYGAKEERYRGRVAPHRGEYSGSMPDYQPGYDYHPGYDRAGFMSGGGYAGGGLASRWGWGGDYPARGYGGGYYPNTRQGRSYPGRRDYGDHERGFWDKASDEISSWFGDEEAERRRRMDQRHRGRGPRGYVRSDERIREDVNDRLTDDWLLDATDIEVEVNDREVTLSGHVSSRSDKRRAEDIAENVSGVTHVQNNLRIKRNDDQSRGPTGVTL